MSTNHIRPTLTHGAAMRQLGIGLLLMLCAAFPLQAQEPTPQQEVVGLRAQLEALSREMTALKNDLKAATKKPPLSPNEAMKLVQQKLLATFVSLRDQAKPGCDAIHGKLSIAIDGTGQVTTVTCAVK